MVVVDGFALCATVAVVSVGLVSAVFSADLSRCTACSAAVIDVLSSTHELAAVLTTCAIAVLVPELFVATSRNRYEVPASRPLIEAVTLAGAVPAPASSLAGC